MNIIERYKRDLALLKEGFPNLAVCKIRSWVESNLEQLDSITDYFRLTVIADKHVIDITYSDYWDYEVIILFSHEKNYEPDYPILTRIDLRSGTIFGIVSGVVYQLKAYNEMLSM